MLTTKFDTLRAKLVTTVFGNGHDRFLFSSGKTVMTVFRIGHDRFCPCESRTHLKVLDLVQGRVLMG